MKSVLPRVYLVGITMPDETQIMTYLADTGQAEFQGSLNESTVGPQLNLVSMFAKLCYKSLVLGKNANVTRIRDIQDNIRSIIKTGHGSVLEHVSANFIFTDVSRVFTHELVRHRVGTAFSQTSGRYVSIDSLDMVLPPELSDDSGDALVPCPACHEWCDSNDCLICAGHCRVTPKLCCSWIAEQITKGISALRAGLIKEGDDFDRKKKLTSAIRRFAPNGQANEIAFTCNFRTLLHLIELRTSCAAEWEIRYVFDQVALIVQTWWPVLLEHGVRGEMKDGIAEWKGLRI